MRSAPTRVYFTLISTLLLPLELASATQPARLYSKHGGAPRPWQVGISATPWATVNIANSNVITVIPLFAHSGRGPSVVINLYHNSIAALSDQQTPAACGFVLSDGWSTSYSGQVVSIDSTTVRVIEDDGTTNTFTKENNVWTPPAGVYDTLAYDSEEGWLLTRQNRSYRKFDATWGRLTTVGDASGNELTLSYDSFEALEYITDAAGRQVDFHVQTGKLQWIRDDLEPGDSDPDPQYHHYRTWALSYDQDGNFETLTDPMNYTRSLIYTDGGRIGEFTDRNEKTWTFAGKTFTFTVTDPSPLDSQYQQFDFTEDVMAEEYGSTYTDRRGQTWEFAFDNSAPPSRALKGTIDPLAHTTYLSFDSNRNLTEYVDQLGSGPSDDSHKWKFTYDSATGNCLTATDPLGHKWQATYDSTYPTNLLTITPPSDNTGGLDTSKTVELQYTNSMHPTSPTKLIEPADGNGNGAATTEVFYYGASNNHPEWKGLVEKVVDANSVGHFYDYDQYGQPYSESEGKDNGDFNVLQFWAQYNAGGMMGPFNYAKHESGGAGLSVPSCCSCTDGEAHHNDNADMTGIDCPGYLCNCQWPTPPPGSCTPPPDVVPLRSGCGARTYDREGRLTTSASCVEDARAPTAQQSATRDRSFEYDVLGATTQATLDTTEPQLGTSATFPTRAFEYELDYTEGEFTRTGPDGQETNGALDERGQLASISRGSLGAIFSYYPDGATDTVTRANGTRTRYLYDNARRLTDIIHERECGSGWVVMLSRHNTYSADGLITQVDEVERTEPCSSQSPENRTSTFSYDSRNRLTGECHQATGVNVCYGYTYDQLGNRLQKNVGTDTSIVYRYDVHQGENAPSWANRLLGYTTYQSAAAVSDVTYEYGEPFNPGQPTRVVYHDLAPCTSRTGPEFHSYRLYYDTSQRLWLVYEETWDRNVWNETAQECQDGDCTNHQRVRCTEFRYDSGRARYMVRTRNPNTLAPNDDALWTDYDGDSPYEDYKFFTDPVVLTSKTGYAPGLGQRDSATGDLAYHHGDQIDSMRQMTDGGGVLVRRQLYTAFGEPIQTSGSQSTRYQYAGRFGYECVIPPGAPAPLPFLHVGERWYDPGSGRFLQRDPSGIEAGPNTYSYSANPTSTIDPDGRVVYVVQFLPFGTNPGHTILYSTETGAYISHIPTNWLVPCSSPVPNRSFGADADKYKQHEISMWIYYNLDENKIARVARRVRKKQWCYGYNCINAVIEGLVAGGTCAPAEMSVWYPSDGACYFGATADFGR